MHEALSFLKKQTDAARKALDELAGAVAKQSELETRKLEALEFGNEFDGERALPQERVVEALQEALEGVEEARDGLARAVEAFREMR